MASLWHQETVALCCVCEAPNGSALYTLPCMLRCVFPDVLEISKMITLISTGTARNREANMNNWSSATTLFPLVGYRHTDAFTYNTVIKSYVPCVCKIYAHSTYMRKKATLWWLFSISFIDHSTKFRSHPSKSGLSRISCHGKHQELWPTTVWSRVLPSIAGTPRCRPGWKDNGAGCSSSVEWIWMNLVDLLQVQRVAPLKIRRWRFISWSHMMILFI